MTNWKPTPEDIEWTKELLRVLEKQATWGVPCSASVLKIDKTKKEFQIVTGDEKDETNQRICKVLQILGWKQRRDNA